MKMLLIVWLCFFTLYSPLELSRLIFAYGLSSARIFELCFIWVLYLLAVVILARVVRVYDGPRTA